jgi:hypothetical protein
VARQPLLQWLAIEVMDRDTFKNWVKVMQALEEAGKQTAIFIIERNQL